MGKRAKQLEDGTGEMPGAEGIREAAGTHPARTYIEQLQATVGQWVALRHLFEVCVRGEGYERGGWRRKVLWQKEATGKQLWATLEHA